MSDASTRGRATSGSQWLDAPTAVRMGQEIDLDALAAYLRAELPEMAAGPLTIEQFPSGYSNLTYLVRTGDRAVVLRRAPAGVHIATAHDMGREHRILTHLSRVWARAPRPLAFCGDDSVIGTPFYLMERVEGVILRKEMPAAMTPSSELAGRVATSLVETLADLHGVDYEAAGLGKLGRPAGYARRQIEGWTTRYRRAETEEVLEADRVAAWLVERIPADGDAALIHNDFKHDNVVLDPGDWSRVVAVLDWEMATLGDPLMDLGTTLAYWVRPDDPTELLETRLGPTMIPGTPGREEVVETYAGASGRAVDDIAVYFVYGLFKVAVIVQQLHWRFVTGRTSDERFRHLDRSVRALCATAWQAAQKGRIADLY